MPSHRALRDMTLPLGAFIVLALIAWFSHLPGLSGAFLFDDFVNLNALGAYGPVDNTETFWRYITSGTADPTGRPIALLTFLLDANNWPADPWPFKRTNVLLHLLNGGLLFVLLWRWGRLLVEDRHQSGIAAAFGAGLWMLHPLMVSTTLYIVQREAMLPATFILLGLLGYTAGHLQMAQGKQHGLWLAAGSVVLFTVLAVLSKANGALLPALTWLADRLFLSRYRPLPEPRSRSARRMRLVVLALPMLLLAAYLTQILWNGFVHGTPAHRPWTMGERLMTESRIFFDYLTLLWVPRPYSGGLFNDAYVVSKGLLDPTSTLFAVLALLTLVAGAVAWCRQLGVWALAFLFFAIGHVMETGVLPLELYYEHRNYLPAMLMFWPPGLLLAQGISTHRNVSLRPVRILLLLILPLLMAGMTWARASLWGDPLSQARSWVDLSPDSPRARAYAAQLEMDRGNLSVAIEQLEELLAQKPDEVQLALNLLGAKCQRGGLDEADLIAAEQALRTATILQRIGYEWFEKAIPAAANGSCPGLGFKQMERLIAAARSNPRVQGVPGRQQDLNNATAQLALLQHQSDAALEHFNRAYDAQPKPGVALVQAALLASAGYYGQALAHLDHAKANKPPPKLHKIRDMAGLHQWLLEREGYWASEMTILECKIAQDAGPNEIHRCDGRPENL